jgi:methylisocitrate lyase
MFAEFAKRMPGVKLLANMTEFGRTPFLTAKEFEELGYSMVIWPSATCASRTGRWRSSTPRSGERRHAEAARPMQTRAQLYETIGYHDYEALDASLVKTVVPEGMPQG